MRSMALAILALAAAVAVSAQQEPAPPHVGVGATTFSDISNLPVARIGDDDLLGVTVYDAPELTRTIRVSPEGDIWLPMVKQPIHAAGLYPEDLEKVIAAALTDRSCAGRPGCDRLHRRVSKSSDHRCRRGKNACDVSGYGKRDAPRCNFPGPRANRQCRLGNPGKPPGAECRRQTGNAGAAHPRARPSRRSRIPR